MANKKLTVCALRTGEQKCCFCGSKVDDELKYGKFYEYQGIVTHYFCLLFSSNMEQKGEDEEGILGFLPEDIHKELRRGRRLNCSFCKKNGATLGCTISRCQKKFHYPCGLLNGSLHQFFGEFRSYCRTHRPLQKIDERIKQLTNSSDRLLCYICYDDINLGDSLQTLWAPCCKKSAWFHRPCVQQLALSAGYFFKCPLCNNKRDFQKAMLEYGIYIPCQDASWELVPNAYEELLYRHNRCDAKMCLCPKGRTHSSTKWAIVLCRLCGSQGVHVGCGPVNSSTSIWECDECRNIIIRSPRSSITNSSTPAEVIASDSDSDSDISVGGSSPTNDELGLIPVPVRIKPGPRSFKMLQAKIAKSVASQLPKPEIVTKEITEPGSSANDNSQDINRDTTVENPAETIAAERIDNKLASVEGKSKNSEDIINLSSDEDDAIEIISESIVSVTSNSLSKVGPFIISPGDPDINLQICNVTTIAPELHAKIDEVNKTLTSRKRDCMRDSISDESPKHIAKKRKVDELLDQDHSRVLDNIEIDGEDSNENSQNKDMQLENDATNHGGSGDEKRTCLLHQAFCNADVVAENEETNDAWQVKSDFLPIAKADCKVENNSREIDLTESPTNTDFDPNVNCDGDAGTGPAVDPRPGTSADSPTGKLLGPTKLDENKSSVCSNSTGCPSPSPSTSSVSNCSSGSRTSTSSSNTSASSDRSGLRENVVHVNDIKFRLIGISRLEITVQNKYKIDMMLDEVSQQDAGDQSVRKVCCTPEPVSNFPSLCSTPMKGNDLDDAKENLNPLSADNASVLSGSRTPFSPQNPEGFSTPTKFVQNSTCLEESTSEKAITEPPKCKVSIDLSKIGNLLNSWPNLFKKSTDTGTGTATDCQEVDVEVR